MRTFFFTILTLLSFTVLGQPGGGGGIIIQHIYDQSGKEIDIEHNKDYTLKCYLLNDTLLATKNIYSKLENNFKSFQVDSVGYIPHYRDSTELVKHNFTPVYKFKAVKLREINPTGNYRIFLSNNEDTMVVDFINIIGRNPHGTGNQIDSLIFLSGYYQYKREDKYHISYPSDTLWIITHMNQVDFNLLSTTKNKSIKYYEKNRLKKERKKYKREVRVDYKKWKKVPERLAKEKKRKEKEEQVKNGVDLTTLSREQLVNWINYKEKSIQGSSFVRRNFEGYTEKQLVKEAQKTKKNIQNKKLEKQKRTQQLEKEQLKEKRKRARKNKVYKRRLLAFNINRMDRNALMNFILYYDKSHSYKELSSMTDEQVYKMAKQIAEKKKQEKMKTVPNN